MKCAIIMPLFKKGCFMGFLDRIITSEALELEDLRRGNTGTKSDKIEKYEDIIEKVVGLIISSTEGITSFHLRDTFDFPRSITEAFSYVLCKDIKVSYLGYNNDIRTNTKGKKENPIDSDLLTDFVHYVGFLKYVKDKDLNLEDFSNITSAYSKGSSETSSSQTAKATERIEDFFATRTDESFETYFQREFIEKHDMNDTRLGNIKAKLKDSLIVSEESSMKFSTTTSDLVKLAKVIIDEDLLPRDTRRNIVVQDAAKGIKNLQLNSLASSLLSHETIVLMDGNVALAISRGNDVAAAVNATPTITHDSVKGLLKRVTEQSLVEQTAQKIENTYRR